MKIGFLIIDMQKINIQSRIEKKLLDEACEYINYVSNSLRSKGHLVMHIQDIEGMQESNREMYDIVPEIHIEDTDMKLTKEYSNAFWKTDLEQILLNQNVELLIISGLEAEHCVLFTFNGARERGFKPVILQKGILSTHSDAITSTYRDRSLISYPVIDYLIKNEI